MSRALLAGAVGFWVGATLVLSELRWMRRRPLVARLQPYSPGAGGTGRGDGVLSVASFREVVGPLASDAGHRLARLLGVSEDLSVRLQRLREPVDATRFRVRQMGQAAMAFAIGTLLSAVLQPPLPVVLVFVLGGPLLAFLVVEQRLATATAQRQRRTFVELPVLSEQLGMLLGAGFSLGAALNRLAQRGRGVCAEDLAHVCGRIRQGLSEVDALREWSELADVPALGRLVSILSLNREAGDLGRLISDEARTVRREVQRELIEEIERRAQQVWIPVTVATLVPGAVLLAVPFIEAMRLFSAT